MTATSVPTRDTADRELVVERVFNAPRELVFKAWTEPASFAQWFGGAGATIPLDTVAMDVRAGGAWRATMFAGPDHGEIHWTGVYSNTESSNNPPTALPQPTKKYRLRSVLFAAIHRLQLPFTIYKLSITNNAYQSPIPNLH